jgi:hypothetical protein
MWRSTPSTAGTGIGRGAIGGSAVYSGRPPRRSLPRQGVLGLTWSLGGLRSSLIRQVYDVDPALCPRCGGTTWIIAVIERATGMRQILDQLGLPSATLGLRAPPDQPAGPSADQPREWSYDRALTTPPH